MRLRPVSLLVLALSGLPFAEASGKLPDIYAWVSYKSSIPGELRPGQTLSLKWWVSNNSTMCIPEVPCYEEFGPAYGPWDNAAFLSKDAVPDEGDILLGIATYGHRLGPGDSQGIEMQVVIPADCPAGEYRVVVYADYVAGQASGSVTETNEGNNWDAWKQKLAIIRDPKTFYVDDDGPSDPRPGDPHTSDPAEDGSTEHPFDMIGEAIEASMDGDTVVVNRGSYKERVYPAGKNIVLRGTEPHNSTVVRGTIIEGDVVFAGTEEAGCVLAGFTIDGTIAGFDQRIDPEGQNHTHATISHCVLEGITTGCGGVIRNCDGVISNCIVADTSYMCLRPPPVPAISGCHGLITNCTFVRMRDGIEVFAGRTCTIENCISYESQPIVVMAGATANVSYCAVQRGLGHVFGSGTVNWGPGNIEGDPCFAEPGGGAVRGDYHLKSQAGRWNPQSKSWVRDDVTSPCIDAANPGSAVGAEAFANGGIVNMGAYGGTAEASKSYFGGPVCETIVAGDVNGDCRIDFADFAFIVYNWLKDIDGQAGP
ncbi:MAG: hypothetical protein JSU94_10090 [Phycisphaerales bacterium]|nr:MAG: hypothetical protein JSU94_10090 [Phycisphaerales bacterium]